MTRVFVRILADASEARARNANVKDRGWRLRLIRGDGEGNAHLYEEQVFPERVHRIDAQHFRDQREILLTPDEQVWLRDTLAEMLGEVVDVDGWREEIRRARAGELPLAMERDTAVRQLCREIIAASDAVEREVGTRTAFLPRAPKAIVLAVLAVLDGSPSTMCACGHGAHRHYPKPLDGDARTRWSLRSAPGCAGPLYAGACVCPLSCEEVLSSR